MPSKWISDNAEFNNRSVAEYTANLCANLIVSSPDASIYTVIDVRNLVAPMRGFYNVPAGEENPGSTQFRISFVETPENLAKIPELFTELLKQYEAQR